MEIPDDAIKHYDVAGKLYALEFNDIIYMLQICIVAEGDLMPSGALLSPCGSCRQVMLESEARQNNPIEVLLVQRSGEILILDSVQNLLPFGFTK